MKNLFRKATSMIFKIKSKEVKFIDVSNAAQSYGYMYKTIVTQSVWDFMILNEKCDDNARKDGKLWTIVRNANSQLEEALYNKGLYSTTRISKQKLEDVLLRAIVDQEKHTMIIAMPEEKVTANIN
ncbi:hypothetical protein [Bacillus sp. Brlt_9]|uniref:hypothetical protein n=1 Tax=Bacillus sp. Brlt_9 TaxID=3110916 RepID=UPI003F7C95BC